MFTFLGTVGAWLASNPLVMGAAIKVGLDSVKAFLARIDATGAVPKAAGWLDPMLAVLTFIGTAVQLGLAGHLSSIDLNAALTWVQMLLAANGTGTKTITNVINPPAPVIPPANGK